MRPVSLDQSVAPAPITVMAAAMLSSGTEVNQVLRTVAAVSPDGERILSEALIMVFRDLWARVRGQVRRVLQVFDDGTAEVDGVGTVPASELLYPTYDPRAGLDYVPPREGAHEAILRNPSFEGHQYALSLADRTTRLRVSDCKFCGEAIAWTKSKAGKNYPCEVRMKNSEEFGVNADVLRAAPWEPHRCQAREGALVEDWPPESTFGDDQGSGEYVIWADQAGNVRGGDLGDLMWGPWMEVPDMGIDPTTDPLPFAAVEAAKDERFEGVGLKEDDDGYYVTTHRARGDSYPTPEDIPQDEVDFIESTGAFLTVDEAREAGRAALAADPDFLTRGQDEDAFIFEGHNNGWSLNADAYPDEYEPCNRCDGTKHGDDGDICGFCGGSGLMVRDDLRAVADLHDEPEPALPSTDGAEEEGGPEATTAPSSGPGTVPSGLPPTEEPSGREWLMEGSGQAAAAADSADIAAMAQRYLKEGMKAFTPAEQAQIINEGEGVTAANLDLLDIAGTHYEMMEASLAAEDEEEDDYAWLG
jgi:hypothetical protein